MAYSRRRDFLFCELCGSMLSLNSTKYANCPLCGSQRNAKGISGRETCYTVTAEDIRRELGIKPFVKVDKVNIDFEGEEEVQGPTSTKKCENCGNTKVTYKSQQTRSADEGETTFYTCTNCNHTFKE